MYDSKQFSVILKSITNTFYDSLDHCGYCGGYGFDCDACEQNKTYYVECITELINMLEDNPDNRILLSLLVVKDE